MLDSESSEEEPQGTSSIITALRNQCSLALLVELKIEYCFCSAERSWSLGQVVVAGLNCSCLDCVDNNSKKKTGCPLPAF